MLRKVGNIVKREGRYIPKYSLRGFENGVAIRFQSNLSPKPTTVFTKLSDQADPSRNSFFQYSWGSWLKNDKEQKKMRETKFSIEGVAKLLDNISKQKKSTSKYGDKETQYKAPVKLNDGSVIISDNITSELLGEESKLEIKSIASIHEGKHNRIYKLTVSNGKEFVLRIPYKLESDHAISQKIRSEVATLDFLSLKLGLNVPRVISFGPDRSNALESPYILMQYIEGDLLMKKWNPLIPDSIDSERQLRSVIGPIAEFNCKALSISFNKFGSLFFSDDVDYEDSLTVPYEGESNPSLANRWRIGPSVDRYFFRNKMKLSAKQTQPYNKSIESSSPLSTLVSLPEIEIENLKNRLALAQADAGMIEDKEKLMKIINAFENLKKISLLLIDTSSSAIKNMDELIKPRLSFSDLDPLNVIISKKDGKEYFVDFEYTSIKPFLFTVYPSFVAYQGFKIYDLKEDIPGYADLDEAEKQQYDFMYYKTRNERLWETEMNDRRHDLIAVASPFIKLLKNPYIQGLEFKNDNDYLYIQEAIIQLGPVWETLASNGLCHSKYPFEFTQEFLEQHKKDLENHQNELGSTPFVATGGWIPQDMFTSLKEQNILIEDANGNYTLDTEKILSN